MNRIHFNRQHFNEDLTNTLLLTSDIKWYQGLRNLAHARHVHFLILCPESSFKCRSVERENVACRRANVARGCANVFCERANLFRELANAACEFSLRARKSSERGLRTLPANFDFCREFKFRIVRPAESKLSGQNDGYYRRRGINVELISD